jgi:predicted transcriptional regulator
MPSRRSKIDIYIELLTSIQGGECRPTRIMYSINLSWKPLCQLLESLENKGLIEKMGSLNEDKRSKNLYKITEKGESVLQYFKGTKNLVDLGEIPVL